MRGGAAATGALRSDSHRRYVSDAIETHDFVTVHGRQRVEAARVTHQDLDALCQQQIAHI